jgi:hypothetical protein
MDDQSFIASELRDLTTDQADFRPFEVVLLNGERLEITRQEQMSMLSGGIIYQEPDRSYRIVPYDKILYLQTIFDL